MEPWVWAIIIATFLVIEFFSFELVSIWFAIGSIAGLILSFLPVSIWTEILVSIFLSLVLLTFTRSIIKRWLESKVVQTNADAMCGVETLLLKEITKTQSGEVKINGTTWTAISDTPIKKDKTVKIISINGNKLSVEEVDGTVTNDVSEITPVKSKKIKGGKLS